MPRRVLIFIFLYITITYTHPDETWWYKTQTGTGLGNCGPAAVAMSIYWSTGADISVQSVRERIGYRLWDGATSFDELYNSLIEYEIEARFENVRTVDDLIQLVYASDIIVIALIDAGEIEVIDNRYYGKTHYYEGGHCVVIYDYFADAFQVHDPIIYGEERLYKRDQVWRALRQGRVIVVQR